MYPLASLEDVLSPVGVVSAPAVGLVVDDWDEDVLTMSRVIVDNGYAVSVVSQNDVSMEQEGDVYLTTTEEGRRALYYYKQCPKGGDPAIPIMVFDQGVVRVSHEGKMKELAEMLGLLDRGEDDDSIEPY